MDGCVVCSVFREPERSSDLWVAADELVLLGHVPPSPGLDDAYPGHLLLVPRRHVESPAALNDAEAERIGYWLSRAARLLETVSSAEHVYLLRLGDGWRHLHFHVVPRYRGTPDSYRGMEVRNWSGIPRQSREAVVQVTRQLREAEDAWRAGAHVATI